MTITMTTATNLCRNGHFFLWAGDINCQIPAGYPCACGKEKYPQCGQDIVKPVDRDDIILEQLYNSR